MVDDGHCESQNNEVSAPIKKKKLNDILKLIVIGLRRFGKIGLVGDFREWGHVPSSPSICRFIKDGTQIGMVYRNSIEELMVCSREVLLCFFPWNCFFSLSHGRLSYYNCNNLWCFFCFFIIACTQSSVHIWLSGPNYGYYVRWRWAHILSCYYLICQQ